MQSADQWIRQLGLKPHPEGGYYREAYRATERIDPGCLPGRFEGERDLSTAIYFLLKSDEISALHRLKSDEIWHFYQGSTLTLHLIYDSGDYEALRLGLNSNEGAEPLHIVPKGVWFGATVDESDCYTLTGATVAPGFDFRDFELGVRSELIHAFPGRKELIRRLTPG